MRLGCHCVLFGPKIVTDMNEVLTEIESAGAEGCEIGQRFLGPENADKLRKSLKEHDLELAGMHCNGVNWMDLVNAPEKSRESVMQVAVTLQNMPNKNIIMTGAVDREGLNNALLNNGAVEETLHDKANILVAARHLEEIAAEVHEKYGVQLHYHNHSWEFADDGMMFYILMEHCPSMNLALDTGWAAISGFDPVDIIEKYPDRISYVHLRDYKKAEEGLKLTFQKAHECFVKLGSGDMNYPNLMSCLKKYINPDGWAIVEYETGDFDYLSYIRAIGYLDGVRTALDYTS